MKTFMTFVKMLVFAVLAVYLGKLFLEHGGETFRDMERNSELNWVEFSKDLGLLFGVICCATWVKHSWEQRHQGPTKQRKKARRGAGKIVDNIRIPK